MKSLNHLPICLILVIFCLFFFCCFRLHEKTDLLVRIAQDVGIDVHTALHRHRTLQPQLLLDKICKKTFGDGSVARLFLLGYFGIDAHSHYRRSLQKFMLMSPEDDAKANAPIALPDGAGNDQIGNKIEKVSFLVAFSMNVLTWHALQIDHKVFSAVKRRLDEIFESVRCRDENEKNLLRQLVMFDGKVSFASSIRKHLI